MSTFTSCPLAFRFSYIERLPEPPSAPASKGTLVHLALQHLMWRPPADRTIDAALLDLARAGEELAADPEFSQLELSEQEWASFHADAEVLLRRYFEIEDPRTITVLGVELRVTAETADGVVIRGIIDRLELDADGELVITDYKTGREPGEGWEQQSMAGIHIYSLAVRAHARSPAQADPTVVPVEARADHHPAERPIAAWRRGEIGRGDEGGPHCVRARRLPAASVGAVLVLLVQGVLPGVRR